MSSEAPDPATLAADWYAAWNAHDLERILAHYDEGIRFRSPFVVALTGDPRGELHGLDPLRAYFARALERFPDLRFEPRALLTGVGSAVLHYVSVERRLAAEVLVLAADGRIAEVLAHYGPPGSADA